VDSSVAELQVILKPNDDLLQRFAAMIERLGAGKVQQAEVRALNHVGAKAFTAVKRALVAQTSLSRDDIEKGLRTQRASRNRQEEFRIVGKGARASLGHFRPVQFSYGVRAKVWGRFQRYPRTFIIEGFGGNVFKRVGAGRSDIKKLWGPGIASELLKAQSAKAFEEVAKELGPRLAHEMDYLLAL
jgi:hypothetical protein